MARVLGGHFKTYLAALEKMEAAVAGGACTTHPACASSKCLVIGQHAVMPLSLLVGVCSVCSGRGSGSGDAGRRGRHLGCCLALLDCACVVSACAGPTDVLGVCDAASSIGSSISSGVTGGVTSVMALFGAKGAGRGGPSVSAGRGCWVPSKQRVCYRRRPRRWRWEQDVV